MTAIKMALHRGDGVAHQAEGHLRIRRALMFDNHINVALARGGFE